MHAGTCAEPAELQHDGDYCTCNSLYSNVDGNWKLDEVVVHHMFWVAPIDFIDLLFVDIDDVVSVV